MSSSTNVPHNPPNIQATYSLTRPQVPVTMEIENIELAIEDILEIPHGWITQVFVESQKTDVGIVGLLYARYLLVTCDRPSFVLTRQHKLQH